jgi:DNA-binding MarR family transcriptional regulator
MPLVWPDGVDTDRVDTDCTDAYPADAGAATFLIAAGEVDSLFDPLVVNPGRLSILLALLEGTGTDQKTGRAGETASAGVEFVDLRRRTRLTDGNLACHARRLAAGGMVAVAKRFRAGKPVTTFRLTDAGRTALTSHVRNVAAAVGLATVSPGGPAPVRGNDHRVAEAFAVAAGRDEDDWVD